MKHNDKIRSFDLEIACNVVLHDVKIACNVVLHDVKKFTLGGNHKCMKKDKINPVQLSLLSHPLWVALHIRV